MNDCYVPPALWMFIGVFVTLNLVALGSAVWHVFHCPCRGTRP